MRVLGPLAVRVLDPDVVIVLRAQAGDGAVGYRVTHLGSRGDIVPVLVLKVLPAVLVGVIELRKMRRAVSGQAVAETTAVAMAIGDSADYSRRRGNDRVAVTASEIDTIPDRGMVMVVVNSRHCRA